MRRWSYRSGVPLPPSGTVTFLFTDIEGSTRLWEQDSEVMRDALAAHDDILRRAIERHGGVVFATGGDGFAVAFRRAVDALHAAAAIQVSLANAHLPSVRIGVHTGEAVERDGDYFGPAVNRAARLMAIGHGGQVLVSQAAASVSEAHADLRDLGAHRLRDLSQSEHVFQLVVAGAPQDFPPLRSLDATPTNLPVQLTSFLGRADELDKVSGLLREHRLVTITGVGGVGKTRLALHVAAELLPTFSDGAWLCELARANDSESVLQIVAATLGVQLRGELSLLDSIGEYLRAKQLLLVLDNCEHVIETASALAETVLRAASGVRLLATSREGLAAEGEFVRPLRALSVPPDADVRTAAVELFIERALAAGAGVEFDAVQTRAVVEICRRLDGIPLAIELAAARAAVMSPIDIAARLDERFRLLTGGRRTAVERHQTLRATVEWSYLLLTSTERAVFDRFGVFGGTFDIDAALAVCAGASLEHWDVLDAVAALIQKSLVQAEEQTDGRIRYVLLETLRQYAAEQLEHSGLADGCRRAHAKFYCEATEEIGRGLITADEGVWRDVFRTEIDNIRAAVVWALDRDDPEDILFGVRAIAAVGDTMNVDTTLGVGSWARRALTKVDGAAPSLRAAVFATASYDAHLHGDNATAIELGRTSVEIGTADGTAMPSIGYFALAMASAMSGHSDLALEVIAERERILAEAEATDHELARFYAGLVPALVAAGDMSWARRFADKGLDHARRAGSSSMLAQAWFGRGMVLAVVDPIGALEAFDTTIKCCAVGISFDLLGPALYQRAGLRAARGDSAGALEDLRRAVVHLWEIGQVPQLDGAFGFSMDILVAAGEAAATFVIVGAIHRGVLQQLRTMPVPPERDPAATLRAARAGVGESEQQRAMDFGASLDREQLVEWLLSVIDARLTKLND